MIIRLRRILFCCAYWATSVFFVLVAAPLLLLPGRKPVLSWIRLYTKTIAFWLRWIAGVRVTVRGMEKLPPGPVVIAAKHQSWGDGILLFAALGDLAFVAGDHLEKFPLVGGIVRKMGAILVDNCGGALARARLIDQDLNQAKAEGRRILIYPEGHLAPVGQQYRYKKGVYHIYAAYDRPVAPVATNLGLRWPQQSWRLTPGEAVIDFLDPIEPGLGKDAFMTRLEQSIETRSIELLGLERPQGVAIGAVLPDPLG